MSDLAHERGVDDDRPDDAFDPRAIDRGLEAVTWGSYEAGASPEFRSTALARVGSLLLAALVAWGVVRWMRQVPSYAREDTSLWWRAIQVGLAAVGIVAALVAVGLLVRYAATGRLTSRELWIRSDVPARLGSGAVALVLTLGSVAWGWRAYRLFRDQDGWYRWTQLLIAIVGVVIAGVAVMYFLRIALTDRTWRRWRGVAVAFGVVSGSWTLLFWLVN